MISAQGVVLIFINRIQILTSYQKGAYCFDIRLFNGHPLYVKKLAHNSKQFRLALSIFLHSQSLHTLDEYFNQGNLLRYRISRTIRRTGP